MLLPATRVLDLSEEVTIEQEREFFESIRLPSGVFKTTASKRLDEVNRFCREQWATEGFRPSHLLDVAASSCLSSAEWADDLVAAGHDVRIVATDVLLDVNWVTLSPDHRVLTDRDGNVLQHEIGGRVVRAWIRRRDFAGLGWLNALRANRRARARLRSTETLGSRGLSLVSRAARAHDRLTFREQDIFQPPEEPLRAKFDVVRAANILNRGYFAEERIAVAVTNLSACLRGPGSYLIVTRSWHDGSNHATLFRLERDENFKVAARFGQGSEVEDIVLASTAGNP